MKLFILIIVFLMQTNLSSGEYCKLFDRGNSYLSMTDDLWSSVPSETSTLDFVPNGCQCVNDLVTDATCTTFVCHETCNIHRGQCDPYCCSDPDCSSSEIKAFQGENKCLENGATQIVQHCYELDSLEEVNAKYGMTVEQDDTALSGLLCISVDNNPIEGVFLPPPNKYIGNQDLFDTPTIMNSKLYSFEAYEKDQLTFRESLSDPLYIIGAPIRAARQNHASSSLEIVNGGFLSIPTAGPDGTCVTTNYAEFTNDISSGNQCVTPTSSISENCGATNSLISYDSYATGLVIGKTPASKISDNNNDGDGGSTWINVQVRSVYQKNLETGIETLVDTPQSGSPVTTWDETTNTCKSAVVGLSYEIGYNENGILEDFKLDMTLADIVLDSNFDSISSGITQTFQVHFNGLGTGNKSSIQRLTSGNPGYLKARPIQSGNLLTKDSKSAIQYNYNGLHLTGPNGIIGQCTNNKNWWDGFVFAVAESPTSSPTTTGATPSPSINPVTGFNISSSPLPLVPVMFGVDSVSSCTVEMSYSQFMEDQGKWCQDFSQAVLFSLSDSHIGIYGNSDPLKVEEWVAINVDFSRLSPTKFSPAAGEMTCQNIVGGLMLEILWANTGEVTNPQAMILSARVSFIQTDWTWINAQRNDTKQNFVISQTVSFVQYTSNEERDTIYKPADPTILPAIPSDVFYPFDISSSSAHTIPVQTIIFVLFVNIWTNCF